MVMVPNTCLLSRSGVHLMYHNFSSWFAFVFITSLEMGVCSFSSGIHSPSGCFFPQSPSTTLVGFEGEF